jgi:hypothetical protein
VKTQLSLATGAISTARSSFILVYVVDGRQFHALAALSAGPVEKEVYVSFCSDLQDFDKRKAPCS